MSSFRQGVADTDSGRSIRRTEVWVKELTILIPLMRRKSKKRKMMEMLGQNELGEDLFSRYNFSRSAHFFYDCIIYAFRWDQCRFMLLWWVFVGDIAGLVHVWKTRCCDGCVLAVAQNVSFHLIRRKWYISSVDKSQDFTP